MARLHVKKSVVISLDLKNFFRSIKVQQIVSSLEPFGVTGEAARTLSELCAYKYYVPQGALTSPKISNLVTSQTFGPDLMEFARQKNLTITIYADDITISSERTLSQDDILEVISEVTVIVEKAGFFVNARKTKAMTRAARQWVCGVVVNEKPNLMKKERFRLRAIIHNIQTNGLESEAFKNNMSEASFLASIKGRLAWFGALNPHSAGILADKLEKALREESEEIPITPVESAAVTEELSRLSAG